MIEVLIMVIWEYYVVRIEFCMLGRRVMLEDGIKVGEMIIMDDIYIGLIFSSYLLINIF